MTAAAPTHSLDGGCPPEVPSLQLLCEPKIFANAFVAREQFLVSEYPRSRTRPRGGKCALSLSLEYLASREFPCTPVGTIS